MIVNKANLDEIFKNLKLAFNKAFTATKTVWPKIAMKVQSTGAENNYKWLSKFPKMRKWVGNKHIKSLEAFEYTIKNDDFEVTIEVDRNDVEDGQIGGLAIEAAGAGESAKNLPEEIIEELVNRSFDSKCYDGQFFLDTDHEVNGASVSNKGTSKLDASTAATAAASYGAARTAMREFKDDEGRSLRVNPNVLLVPPALEDTANVLMTSDKLPDGSINIYKGTAEVVVMPGLTSDTAWFLLDTSKTVLPYILQERKAPVLVSQTSMDNESVFNSRKFLFGAEARMSGGYAFWQLAYGSDGTT
ncbi:MAG: head protein [Gammaproteobacteria bacterium]|nr:head protein [Gammaproteobacteria bacterium]